MKRILMLLVVAVLTLGLVAGCSTVKTYDDAGQTIDAKVGDEFIIALGSNPTTGYSWVEDYDETMLELVDQTYEPDETDGEMVGAGGVEYFQFKALKAGDTEVTLTYKQDWEGGSVGETKVFTVDIS
ncbi:MAG: protease inhibitor I42 family protein [Dehalococcoidia bacterium]|jgi:inhibitor of cysteine peptidase